MHRTLHPKYPREVVPWTDNAGTALIHVHARFKLGSFTRKKPVFVDSRSNVFMAYAIDFYLKIGKQKETGGTNIAFLVQKPFSIFHSETSYRKAQESPKANIKTGKNRGYAKGR